MVLRASNAAFTATTSNSVNHWELGSITLADNDSGSAIFPAASYSNLVPGSTATKCIAVTYTGAVPVGVKLFSTITNTAAGNYDATLQTYLKLDIDIGTSVTGMTLGSNTCPGDFVDTGTPDAFPAVAASTAAIGTMGTNYATGHGTWNPSSTTTVIYEFTFLLDASTPDSLQGKALEATFTWEAHST